MSRSAAKLSITQRLILDYIKFKTNHNFKFFEKNDTIALALDLQQSSVKVMINELVREGYLFKNIDNNKRRHLSYSGKEYKPLFVNLTNIDKKILKEELNDATRWADYYKKELELSQIANQRLETENSELINQNKQLQENIELLDVILKENNLSLEKLIQAYKRRITNE